MAGHFIGHSQEACPYQLQGYIYDKDTEDALEHVNVYVQETGTGAVSDSLGFFKLEGFCQEEYHLQLSHVGCESVLEHLFVNGDTAVVFYLAHSANILNEVMISAHDEHSTEITKTIKEQKIVDQSEKPLASLLKEIPGVSSMNTGSGIAKPVVQGLFGNRLTILNNGIGHSGQQWGNGHAPEIDPLVASNIDVLKGSQALTYMGSHLGSVVLVEPKKIGISPHLHGRALYQYASNGRGHTLNLQAQKYHPSLAWKLTGTLKHSGDKHTPEYFLNNTGIREANFALQLERKFSDSWLVDGYLSSFNSELGVLRGAHIGNLTDLNLAIGRSEPFFTEPDFSNEIDAPRQLVRHQLAKLQIKNVISDDKLLKAIVAFQHNNRREFDVRRGGRSSRPAMSLVQWNFFSELGYEQDLNPFWKVKMGLQQQIIDNTNNPETGILPLIPDYYTSQSGAFALLSKKTDHWVYDIGGRYDFLLQKAATISNDLPRRIIRYNRKFNNYTISSSLHYDPNEEWNLTYNLYHTKRNPAINELYSFGLHQGVSGIEEGSILLNNETSTSNRLNLTWNQRSSLSFDLGIYSQYIQDFIYLAPQDEIQLTIRGAFPVFRYQQNDAHIYGFDVSSFYAVNSSYYLTFQYSYIRGIDLENDLGQVNIPSNNIQSGLEYKANKPIEILGKSFENFTFDVESEYVFRQENITLEQDFLLPPDSYFLINLRTSFEYQIQSNRLRFTCGIENLFNTAYRNYLNRQRYYADELGRNIVVGLSTRF